MHCLTLQYMHVNDENAASGWTLQESIHISHLISWRESSLCLPRLQDKDGVSAAAVFAEMAAALYARGTTVCQHLQHLYDTYGYYEYRSSYFVADPPSKAAAVFEALRRAPTASASASAATAGSANAAASGAAAATAAGAGAAAAGNSGGPNGRASAAAYGYPATIGGRRVLSVRDMGAGGC